ncbi:MAG: hypothetical protein C4346_02350 [Chloroflexota bacterium]
MDATKEKTAPSSSNSFQESGWAVRLHGIGRALDRAGLALQDVAIATAGDQTLISALAFRESQFGQPSWVPVTMQIAPDGQMAPVTSDGSGSTGLLGSVPPAKPWTETLVALGMLLDQRAPLYGDFLVLEVEGGFVVQGFQPNANDEHPGLKLVSWEVTEAEILAVLASSQDGRAA